MIASAACASFVSSTYASRVPSRRPRSRSEQNGEPPTGVITIEPPPTCTSRAGLRGRSVNEAGAFATCSITKPRSILHPRALDALAGSAEQVDHGLGADLDADLLEDPHRLVVDGLDRVRRQHLERRLEHQPSAFSGRRQAFDQARLPCTSSTSIRAHRQYSSGSNRARVIRPWWSRSRISPLVGHTEPVGVDGAAVPGAGAQPHRAGRRAAHLGDVAVHLDRVDLGAARSRRRGRGASASITAARLRSAASTIVQPSREFLPRVVRCRRSRSRTASRRAAGCRPSARSRGRCPG